MSGGPRKTVRVVPNECWVVGRLERIAAESDGGAVWTVRVEQTRDVRGMPNFARSRTGESIDVYLHPGLEPAFDVGDRAEARVEYRADERGGRFAIIGDDVRRP